MAVRIPTIHPGAQRGRAQPSARREKLLFQRKEHQALHCCDTWNDIPGGAVSCAALGYFDGVHIGHRAVLERAVQTAHEYGCLAAVFTFSPPEHRAVKGKALLTQTEKLRRLAALGFDLCLCPPFEAFCDLTPEQFVQTVLVKHLGARAVFCGENFAFGKDRRGSADWLRRFGRSAGLLAETLPLTEWNGAPVSSTRIRACLAAGDIPAVNAMLGEAYRIDLPVRHGKRLGTTLGFPTINQIYPDTMLLPREGVYATEVLLNGQWLPGATGLGTRPTVSSGQGVTCETFIADFSGELYGDNISVRFRQYLWPTETFSSLDGLADMIRRAAAASRRIAAGEA